MEYMRWNICDGTFHIPLKFHLRTLKFNLNVFIFKSEVEDCWVLQNIKGDLPFQRTIFEISNKCKNFPFNFILLQGSYFHITISNAEFRTYTIFPLLTYSSNNEILESIHTKRNVSDILTCLRNIGRSNVGEYSDEQRWNEVPQALKTAYMSAVLSRLLRIRIRIVSMKQEEGWAWNLFEYWTSVVLVISSLRHLLSRSRHSNQIIQIIYTFSQFIFPPLTLFHSAIPMYLWLPKLQCSIMHFRKLSTN